MVDTKHIRIYTEDEPDLYKIRRRLSTVNNQLSYADVIKMLIEFYQTNKKKGDD